MPGDGGALLKLAMDAAAAARTDEADDQAGMTPFLGNFLLCTHARSQLNVNNLLQYRRVYEIPLPFSLRLPSSIESSKCFPRDSICLFLDTFTLGLRLPLAEPIVDLMNHTGCVPAMFAPNSLPLLLAAHSAFGKADLPWSIPNFFSLFSTNQVEDFLSFKSRFVHKFSILGFPSSHPRWKSKYFFASSPDGFPFDTNPRIASVDVFKAPPVMDPAIADYIGTPRQLHTRDLVPPFINPSGSVKAEVVPRGSRAKGKKAGGSGGEGGSTHTPLDESSLRTTHDTSTSEVLPLKRSNPPRGGSAKVGKSAAGSSAGAAMSESAGEDPLNVGLAGIGETEPTASGPVVRTEDGAQIDMPTEAMPLRWLEKAGVGMVKRFHNRPTRAMKGELTTFPVQVGDIVRSCQDTVVREAWPREKVPHMVMEHALDTFNSMFYMCQLYVQGKNNVDSLREAKEKLTKKVETTDNFRLAMEKRAESLEVDVNRLSGLVSALTIERDESREEVKMLMAQAEKEASTSKALAEAAAQVEVASMKATVESLRVELANNAVALREAREKVRVAEEATEKDGKELLDLRKKLGDPLALRRLYRGSHEHSEEMEHYMTEGFKMTQEYMLRDVIKSGMSTEDVRGLIEGLDYDTVRDSDLAAASSEEEDEGRREGVNST